MNLNRLLVATLVLGLVAVLGFAGGSQEAQEDAPSIFVYANSTTFPDLNPATGFSNDIVITAHVYETLTYYNPPGSDTVVSPRLATSWEANADSTVWTFEIREGVSFNHGEPLDAAAVKAAL